MLKKSDLAKQFELVVQQEIKNHNDSIYATNQSLNEFRNSLKEVADHSLVNSAHLLSRTVSLDNDICSVEITLKNLSNKLDSFINDQKVLNERNSFIINEMSIAIHERVSKENKLFYQLNKLESVNHEINIKSYKNIQEVDEKLESWYARFLRQIEKFKQEIFSRPSDSHLLRNELEEKIAANGIDVDGIMKEINIAKKNAYVIEKKIENIYTLIERLKGEKP